MKSFTIRQQVTKFRLSNHRLAIETGRHEGMGSNQRFCMFCPDRIEDEPHFLFHCSVLQHLRNTYLNPIVSGITGFEFFPNVFKLKAIMEDVKYDSCKYIAEAMELRNFLHSKPKNLV